MLEQKSMTLNVNLLSVVSFMSETPVFDTTDDQLFLCVNGNSEHVLQTYMPEYARPNFDHNLRPRRHSRQLIPKTNMLNNNDFIIRMLHKDIY